MAKKIKTGRRMTGEELSGFCAQVAMMLNSGLPVYEGMEALAQTHRTSAMAGAYAALSRAVTGHGSLYAALQQDEGWPKYLTEMVGIGEKTGRLEEVMNGLSAHYARESRIRRAVFNAVSYPMVLGAMLLMIILVMILMVLPVFRRVLGNMGVAMTASGNLMMDMGAGVGYVVLGIMGVLLLAVLACCALMQTRMRGRVLRFLRKVFPPLGRVHLQLSSARVASVLSMMLSGGFPLYDALELLPAVVEDDLAKDQLAQVQARVEAGASFGDALAETQLFDELYGCMIRMGCEIGQVDSVMRRAAKDYELRAEESIDALVSFIEPTLVGVLSVVVGAMLLSVMLPMAGIISSIL